MRITNYEKRVTIVLSVKADLVSILGIYYAGQDYETILRDDTDD
jgi:plasmid stabilization system